MGEFGKIFIIVTYSIIAAIVNVAGIYTIVMLFNDIIKKEYGKDDVFCVISLPILLVIVNICIAYIVMYIINT